MKNPAQGKIKGGDQMNTNTSHQTGAELDWPFTMSAEPGKGCQIDANRRRHSRAEVNWPVTIMTKTGPKDVIARNISPSGAFLCCSDVPDLDDNFRLIVKHPEGRFFLATCKNFWSTIYIGFEGILHGMGVKFSYIPEGHHATLSEMICDHLYSAY